MKRALLTNQNTDENSFVQMISRNKKSNYSQVNRDASMMPTKGHPDYKNKTFYIYKDLRMSVQRGFNSGYYFDLHGHQIQEPNSYSFIVDWQL